MPYAKLTITLPQTVWISDVSRAHPDTRFRVLAATANTATGVARIEILGADHEVVCERIADYESVPDLTVFDREDGRSLVQVETTVPLLLTSLQNAGVPLETPFSVCDGQLCLEVTVPQETLSKLGAALDRFDITYTVERIQQRVEREDLLTDRQQALLDEAIERGYYDTPRQTTLVDLASTLGISKSTCSEILHRAEERVVKEYSASDNESQVPEAMASD